MARTAVTVTTLTPGTPIAMPAGTTLDVSNGHVITLPTTIPQAAPGDIIIICKNTSAAAKTVTVKAGTNPPAMHAGAGDVTALSLADGSTTATYGIIGPLPASRVMQTGGTINVDATGAGAATIAAIYIPRNS